MSARTLDLAHPNIEDAGALLSTLSHDNSNGVWGLAPWLRKALDLRPETSLLLSKQNAVALARNLAGRDQRVQRPVERSPGNAQRTGQRAEIAYLQNAALLLLL